MTTQSTRSTAPHAVERWADDTHYCPHCRTLAIHTSAFRAAVAAAFGHPVPFRLLDHAATASALNCGVRIDRLTWACDPCWEAVAPLGGYCTHNARLAGREDCHEGR